MTHNRQSVRGIYQVLRNLVRIFAWFLLFIATVVTWRKFWIEGRTLATLEYGELVSLAILLGIAAILWLFSRRIQRELNDR